MFVKWKAALFKFIIIAVPILIIFGGTFYIGYRNASGKYESVIKELEEENEKLSDPIAQYEIASKEVNINTINSKIQDIGELATIEYLYTDAGKFEDPAKIFGKEIPFDFMAKSFIAKWDGIIKAGVRVEQITVDVNRANKEIVVHIPKADVLSHEIMEDSVETLNEHDWVFNPIKVDDVREFDAVSKEAMKQRAIENGILDKAFENAKTIIYKLIYTDLVEGLGFRVTFEELE